MSEVRSQCGSSKSNRNKPKICAYCGKKETCHIARHHEKHHLDLERKDWDATKDFPDQPLGTPWCKNWKAVALNGVDPVDPIPGFLKGFGAANSKKGSVKGSVQGSSIASQSQYQGDDDVQMENIIQEEEKKEQVAVSQFGQLESNNILGKRSPTKSTGGLEQAVERDMLNEVIGVPVPSNGPKSKRINSNSNSGFGANIPVQAEITTKLSAKSLKTLPEASVEQKQQTQHQQEFLAPLPLAQTFYRDQGMRDSEAIQKLGRLDSNRTGIANVQVLELIDIAPFFAQPEVSKFIEMYKTQLPHLGDLLLLAHSMVKTLSVEKISALAFASILFGGSCWASLPKMFNNLEPAKLDETFLLLSPRFATKFNEHLARWFCSSWRYLEAQTLLLLRYLKEQSLGETLTSNICTISTMVRVEKVDDYLMAVKVFSEYPAFRVVLESIKNLAPQWKPELKLGFEEFARLVGFLATDDNEQLIKAKEEQLVQLPLCKWLEKLTQAKTDSQIIDVASIQFRLNQLQELYGQLPKSYATDLCLSGDLRYKRTLHHVTNPPNSLQFANAQYAALSLRQYQKQLWCVPSGQGKSRIQATITLILLLAGSTTKVHLVFDSKQLMERDKREFIQWLIFNNLEAQVEFHTDLNFECQQGEIILIDEADQFILCDPARFAEKIHQHRCICLTATPDNDDSQGVEREVLKLLGFQIFNGQSTDHAIPAIELKPMTETLPFAPDSELISFIQKELKEHAVLCYCSLEFQELLTAASVSFILMKDGENINDEFLRTLDNRIAPDEPHALIVASSSFGMRGFDYRSQSKGITLILAAPFTNQRQAMQGLYRVGRFGDPCKRYIAKDVSLIDQKEELKYLTALNQFLSQNLKTKVSAHLPKEEKKKAATTTTTNTAKSTPAVGKSKKTQQQNQSSQSTLTTGAFGTTNLNKKQARLFEKVAKVQKKKEEVTTLEQLL